MRNKHNDLEGLARGLDISPSMHHETIQRYGAISEYINSHGIDAKFYPQGSFRTGTVVRPLKNGVESDFDIDVVCEFSAVKNTITPQQVKQSVGNVLQQSALYNSKLQPEDSRCWTLQYDAELANGVGLKLDVVPCAKEAPDRIWELKAKNIPAGFAEQAVAITEKNGTKYSWLPSNPGGYGDWFDQINKRFLLVNLQERKAQFLKENHNIFSADATIEDVPDYYIKTSLQRVIQLMKRHRDIYYSRVKNGKDLRPASVIITTIAAKIASYSATYQIDDLLKYVITEMNNYAPLMTHQFPKTPHFGTSETIIQRKDQKWIIPNPVNPDDNYADSWTDETAKEFFCWISALNNDFVVTSTDNEARYFTTLKSGLGVTLVERALPDSKQNIPNNPRPIVNQAKPWGVKHDSNRV